ncbi:hypothetical protein GQ44DRAFT_140450 [Phaeosphaeriaceae sp. PMI808]|nr:hypothetical protein GQ44DRAFT_140450 [Phaeosphaeriaceae sp. PMI808]
MNKREASRLHKENLVSPHLKLTNTGTYHDSLPRISWVSLTLRWFKGALSKESARQGSHTAFLCNLDLTCRSKRGLRVYETAMADVMPVSIYVKASMNSTGCLMHLRYKYSPSAIVDYALVPLGGFRTKVIFEPSKVSVKCGCRSCKHDRPL